ncbi:MAG: M28 family peptidase [Flavobacteriaceae bacterium]|nr:M28 family peptidase [Flavobacteriaceae bacterium]
MKFLSLSLLTLSLFSCLAQKPKQNIEITKAQEVEELMIFLASDDLKGRDTGTQGISDAAAFIENKFKSFGLKPFFKTYRDSFKVRDLEAFNVVGFIEGNDPNLKKEIIILGAHYDHIGFGKKVGIDSIANGANDNATGTTAVISLARHFAQKKNNKRSFIFALFSAEEKGLLGAKHLAKKLKDQNIDLYTMINFEMLGVPMKDKDYEAYLTGYDLSNMAEKINEYAGTKLLGLLPKAQEFRLFMRSDNHAFYKEFALPSQTISTFDFTNFNHYHKVGDEVELMDFEHMAKLINHITPALEIMSNTPTKEIKMNN